MLCRLLCFVYSKRNGEHTIIFRMMKAQFYREIRLNCRKCGINSISPNIKRLLFLKMFITLFMSLMLVKVDSQIV